MSTDSSEEEVQTDQETEEEESKPKSANIFEDAVLQREEEVESNGELPIRGVLEAHRGEKHLIVLHDFPDPDAISCGYIHQLISEAFDIEADIVYDGRISHQQNIAMVRLLEIKLIRYEDSMDMSQYDGAVFVDNQGTSAGDIVEALEAANVPTLIIVDHHEPQERLSPEFSDIRQSAGSSATIYGEYLQKGLMEMDKSDREQTLAATALMHGILTDTAEFSRAGINDFHAAAYLSQFSDPKALNRIINQSRSRQVMEVIQHVLESRIIAQSFSIASIGYLRAEDRDAIPQAADFLLTEENIHTAIVYGIVLDGEGHESLIGSLRTSKITFDPDSFIKDAFGKHWSGQYFGGGKVSAGAFEIPVGFLAGNNNNEQYKKLKWQVYDQQIKQKIFTKTGIEPDKSGNN